MAWRITLLSRVTFIFSVVSVSGPLGMAGISRRRLRELTEYGLKTKFGLFSAQNTCGFHGYSLDDPETTAARAFGVITVCLTGGSFLGLIFLSNKLPSKTSHRLWWGIRVAIALAVVTQTLTIIMFRRSNLWHKFHAWAPEFGPAGYISVINVGLLLGLAIALFRTNPYRLNNQQDNAAAEHMEEPHPRTHRSSNAKHKRTQARNGTHGRTNTHQCPRGRCGC